MPFFADHWPHLHAWERECFLTMASEYAAFRRQVRERLYPASLEPRLASPRSALHPALMMVSSTRTDDTRVLAEAEQETTVDEA